MNRMTQGLIAMSLASMFAMTGAVAHENDKKPMAGKPMNHSAHSAGSMEMHRAMMQGQKVPMPMSGNVDKDFAVMMTMHHQQAIKMVDVLLQHGKSAELKALARKMKVAQQAEIKQMAMYTK